MNPNNTQRTIHFVYAFGPQKSCPNAIGTEVTNRLSRSYRIVHHQWDSDEVITPSPGDILLGHPYFNPSKCFYLSMKKKGWSRIIGLWPFSHGDPRYSAFQDSVIRYCDLFLLITGKYWFTTLDRSLYREWLPKVRHLDLAVNRNDFPPLKKKFGIAGKRKFVYIGSNNFYKNLPYLSQIATINPDVSFSWIGESGNASIYGLQKMGFVDFQSIEGKSIISQFDFMISVGNSDPNPTTILEAMGWGLIPVCTMQSGYFNMPGIINLPLGNVAKASEIINWANQLPEVRLREMQVENWNALDEIFNWDRFTSEIEEAIESQESPKIGSNYFRRAVLKYYSLIAPWDSTFLTKNKKYFRKIYIFLNSCLKVGKRKNA